MKWDFGQSVPIATSMEPDAEGKYTLEQVNALLAAAVRAGYAAAIEDAAKACAEKQEGAHYVYAGACLDCAATIRSLG